ncbi:hypothetical protein B4100_2002 [Heyndrickxia coagulans]|nr:hypothetical protein B4100_2002 [Heyndrickxia coagulans]
MLRGKKGPPIPTGKMTARKIEITVILKAVWTAECKLFVNSLVCQDQGNPGK